MFRFLLAFTFVFCLFEHSNAYCCFRDPWMLTPKCGCPDFDTPCSVIKCPNTNIGTNSCGCGKKTCSNTVTNPCGQPVYTGSSFCDCGVPACSSYRDTSNVCAVYDNPSPICSCLKTVNNYDCGCEDMRSVIYFPEVEYPVMAMEMKPYYYSSCRCY